MSISLSLGRVVLTSAPTESAPQKLDWDQWVENVAVRYSVFERYRPKRIGVLDRSNFLGDGSSFRGFLHSHHNLQTVDMLDLLAGWQESTVLLVHGAWSFAVSSWVASLKQVSELAHADGFNSMLHTQLDRWQRRYTEIADESLFVLSDVNGKFFNAHDYCNMWLRRVVRSRVVAESHSQAWSAGLVELFPINENSGRSTRLQRHAILDPSSWCGDPLWEEDLWEVCHHELVKTKELWISLPAMGLVADVEGRLHRLGLSEDVKMMAPSIFMGWHPVRDFMSFLASESEHRSFVYMDSQERLQIITAEDFTEQAK